MWKRRVMIAVGVAIALLCGECAAQAPSTGPSRFGTPIRSAFSRWFTPPSAHGVEIARKIEDAQADLALWEHEQNLHRARIHAALGSMAINAHPPAGIAVGIPAPGPIVRPLVTPLSIVATSPAQVHVQTQTATSAVSECNDPVVSELKRLSGLLESYLRITTPQSGLPDRHITRPATMPAGGPPEPLGVRQ